VFGLCYFVGVYVIFARLLQWFGFWFLFYVGWFCVVSFWVWFVVLFVGVWFSLFGLVCVILDWVFRCLLLFVLFG